jgi:hypothetical protein
MEQLLQRVALNRIQRIPINCESSSHGNGVGKQFPILDQLDLANVAVDWWLDGSLEILLRIFEGVKGRSTDGGAC